MTLDLPRIYSITDVLLSGLSHPEQVKRLIDGGASLIQLREKHSSPCEFFDAAVEVMRVARPLGTRIIINDRVDIALAVGADGVHLGQNDLPPAKARELLGPRAIIGYSTHSIEQAIDAARLPIDYIAIGPIFETTTKDVPDAIVGLDGIRSAREAIGKVPLVAIGGIASDNLSGIFEAGADSAAMIGSILRRPESITETMLELAIRFGSMR